MLHFFPLPLLSTLRVSTTLRAISLHTQLLMDLFNSLMDRLDSSEEIDSSVMAFSTPDLNSMLLVSHTTPLTLTSSTSMDQSMVILRELQMTMAPSDLQSVLMLLSSVVMDSSEMLLVSPQQDKQDLMHSSLLVLSMLASLVDSVVALDLLVASVASLASLVPMDSLPVVLT